MAPICINSGRLHGMLSDLRRIGQTDGGGVERLAYSEADVAGRAQVVGWMKEAGLSVRSDAAGNIIGLRNGEHRSAAPIAMGSHTDTVPRGGAFDGSLGVLAAVECAWTMNDAAVRTNHPLEVIVFQNEEGGLVGSALMTGSPQTTGLGRTALSGKTLREGISLIGGDPDDLATAVRRPGDLAVFLELHIEQGAVLEDCRSDIGVVEGIFGIEQWDVTIRGSANHAGTTPMHARRDALLAAADLIRAVHDVAHGTDGPEVGTVGQIDVRPGAPNVIPGEVTLCVELRAMEFDAIRRMVADIETRSRVIAASTGTAIEFECRNLGIKPAVTDPVVRESIEGAARELGLATHLMPSGAGHDAQNLGSIARMGMIFIPSVGGVSHSPQEYSRPEDVENGANVLLNGVLALDRQL